MCFSLTWLRLKHPRVYAEVVASLLLSEVTVAASSMAEAADMKHTALARHSLFGEFTYAKALNWRPDE